MRHSLAVAAVTFAYLALGCSPAHFWLDAGEISAAGAGLGVMHPPGVPGYALLLHLAGLVPVGSLGFRLALLSSVFGAASVGLVASILERRAVHWSVVWGVAIWIAMGWTFVRNGRVAEIYTFGACLTLVTIWGFDPAVPEARVTGHRVLGTMAAVLGTWGFGDLRLLLAPTVAVGWFVARRRDEPWSRWAPLAVVVGSAPVASLPLASARGPTADWGDPETAARLWAHLEARSIRQAYADQILSSSLTRWSIDLAANVERLAEDLGAVGPLLLVLALVGWVLRREDRGLLAMLVGVLAVELFYAVGINPMGGSDRQTGLVLAVTAALIVGVEIGARAEELGRARWAVLPLVGTLAVLPAAARGVVDRDVTTSWFPHAWTREALATAPTGALLLSQSDDLSAGIVAARVLEGARPDLVTAPAQHLHKPAPDAPGPREAAMWAAAARGQSEGARVRAVLDAWDGSVAVESPATGVFASVPWWSERGALPMGIAGGAASDPQPRTAPERALDLVERWMPRARSAEDRRRIARDLGALARAEVAVGGARPDALARAESIYALVLERVDAQHVSTLVGMGAIHDRLGRPDSAVALTRRALELEPDRPAALRNLALYLSRYPTRLDEARALAERAVRVEPGNPANWSRLGQIAELQGDRARAREALDELDRVIGVNEP